jgi:adenylate cyclase
MGVSADRSGNGTRMVNTDHLTKTAWKDMVDTFSQTIADINQTDELAQSGRLIPDDDSLPIGTGRRLHLAVMFLDICRYSSWDSATHVEQEQVLRVMNAFMPQMARIAEIYEGTVEKNTGDGLMAYFGGASSANGQEATGKAMATALSMCFLTENAINPLLIKSGFQAIHFRIGMDYGPVIIARLGNRNRFNSNVALGAIANSANKMLKAATDDEIVVGDQFKLALAPVRQARCAFLRISEDFFYREPRRPYPLYRYDWRWKELYD